MRTDPQPLSKTANGGKKIANKTLKTDIIIIIKWLISCAAEPRCVWVGRSPPKLPLLYYRNASDGAFAAGENTFFVRQRQWCVENGIANLMTPQYLARHSVDTQ